jgi:NAD(P) transhydrogenase subunit alpha
VIVGVNKENHPGETRVALVPASVEKLVALGFSILIESGAGEKAGYSDAEYTTAGASLCSSRAEIFEKSDAVLQIRGVGGSASGEGDLDLVRPGQILIGQHDPLWRPELTKQLADKGVSVLSLEMIPRISRAQSMDVLSSMATLAGYKAVLAAASDLPQMFPMLMTAAGTVQAARVFVLGAGVAGLQAIATARRLGGIVQGYDVRPAAKEQIESLGAKAIDLPIETADSEDAGGYAKAQGEDFNRRQREFLTEVVAEQDVVITTAAIPGMPSPVLITREMVEGMKPGSVIVDLAAERGGNCELTEADQRVEHGGVLILGPTDLPSTVARHASQMFSNNLTTLLTHLNHEGAIQFDMSDEITRGTTIAHQGEVLHERVRDKLGLEPIPEPAEPEATADQESSS